MGVVDQASDLRQALHSRELVTIKRGLPKADLVEGFVVGVGRTWVLINRLDSEIYLNGHTALRRRDISRVRSKENLSSFVARALEMSNESPGAPKGVEIESHQALFMSLSRKWRGLVTVFTERDDPSVCFIGRIESVSSTRLRLLEVTPAAQWREESSSWRLSEITRVDFGGRYEDTLRRVATSA